MRRRLRCGPVIVLGALIVACGTDDAAIGYSRDDLIEGFVFAVDEAGAVASATVFLPDELTSCAALRSRLDQDRVVVLQPGEDGYDPSSCTAQGRSVEPRRKSR